MKRWSLSFSIIFMAAVSRADMIGGTFPPGSSSGGGGGMVSASTGIITPIIFTSSVTNTSAGGESVTFGVTAGTFTGNGSAITNITGANIVTGIPSSVLPSTIAYLSSTNTWTAAQIYKSSVAVNNGFYSVPILVASTATLVSTNTVVLASSTLTSYITLTLPVSNASSNGQILQITKVNGSTQPVIIQSNGTDLIAGSTRTLTLNTIGQTDEIIADGSGGWWPHGQGLQITPPRLFTNPTGYSTNFTVATSSNIVVCPLQTSVPVSIMGFTYDGVVVALSNVAFGVLDNSGNVLASTGPVAIQSGRQALLMNTSVNIPSGNYHLAVQISSTQGALSGVASGDAGIGACSAFTEAAMGIVAVVIPGSSNVSSSPGGVNVLVSGGRLTYL